MNATGQQPMSAFDPIRADAGAIDAGAVDVFALDPAGGDPRHNPALDRATGLRTASCLAVPVRWPPRGSPRIRVAPTSVSSTCAR
jgi:hypothetical protein